MFCGPEPHGRKSCRAQIPLLDNKDIHSGCISTPQSYQSHNRDALGRGHICTVCGVIKHNKVRVKCYTHINAANLVRSLSPSIRFLESGHSFNGWKYGSVSPLWCCYLHALKAVIKLTAEQCHTDGGDACKLYCGKCKGTFWRVWKRCPISSQICVWSTVELGLGGAF